MHVHIHVRQIAALSLLAAAAACSDGGSAANPSSAPGAPTTDATTAATTQTSATVPAQPLPSAEQQPAAPEAQVPATQEPAPPPPVDETAGAGGEMPVDDIEQPEMPMQDPGESQLLPCGDVMPAEGHEPFQAIKRLHAGDTVRVLVYGQSISEQDWWEEVHQWLQQTYPRGDLVMENHARGGCASQCLIGEAPWFLDGVTENRLPGDVYAWQPDLILFHVYGSHLAYEQIVQGFKDNTEAEVLLQTDHRTQDAPDATEDEAWSQMMSTLFIPGFAETYGFSLARIWEAWGEHLMQKNQPASDFLADDVHLNDSGNRLMASLIKPYLCYNPSK